MTAKAHIYSSHQAVPLSWLTVTCWPAVLSLLHTVLPGAPTNPGGGTKHATGTSDVPSVLLHAELPSVEEAAACPPLTPPLPTVQGCGRQPTKSTQATDRLVHKVCYWAFSVEGGLAGGRLKKACWARDPAPPSDTIKGAPEACTRRPASSARVLPLVLDKLRYAGGSCAGRGTPPPHKPPPPHALSASEAVSSRLVESTESETAGTAGFTTICWTPSSVWLSACTASAADGAWEPWCPARPRPQPGRATTSWRAGRKGRPLELLGCKELAPSTRAADVGGGGAGGLEEGGPPGPPFTARGKGMDEVCCGCSISCCIVCCVPFCCSD